MRNFTNVRAVLVSLIGAAGLFAAPGVRAHHDGVCQAMPTSAQRPGTVSCNPRQNCFNTTSPMNATCNALPDSAQCPAMVDFNPRAECLAALAPAPQVSITGVEGGPAGGNQAYSGQPAFMRVLGPNVSMPGNSVLGEQGLVMGTVPVPNCAPPNCLGVSVLGAPNVTGTKRFQLRAGHGHSQAEGTVQLVMPPSVALPGAANTGPTIAVSGTGLKFASPFSNPDMFSSPVGVDHDRTTWNLSGYAGNGRNTFDCRNYQGKSFPGCYKGHEGTDFMLFGAFATMDIPTLSRLATIVAVAPGVVKSVVQSNFDHCFFDPTKPAPHHINCEGGTKTDANSVTVLHDDGTVARYLHLKRDSVPPSVAVNNRVACGQVIGIAGSAGISVAPHLHFDLIVNASFNGNNLNGGQYADPYHQGRWISVDARNVPNGRCPGVAVPQPLLPSMPRLPGAPAGPR